MHFPFHVPYMMRKAYSVPNTYPNLSASRSFYNTSVTLNRSCFPQHHIHSLWRLITYWINEIWFPVTVGGLLLGNGLRYNTLHSNHCVSICTANFFPQWIQGYILKLGRGLETGPCPTRVLSFRRFIVRVKPFYEYHPIRRHLTKQGPPYVIHPIVCEHIDYVIVISAH